MEQLHTFQSSKKSQDKITAWDDLSSCIQHLIMWRLSAARVGPRLVLQGASDVEPEQVQPSSRSWRGNKRGQTRLVLPPSLLRPPADVCCAISASVRLCVCVCFTRHATANPAGPNAAQLAAVVLCCTVLYFTALYCTVLHCTVLCYSMLC